LQLRHPYILFLIRMQDPLKQGLKPTCWVKLSIILVIRMQDPLKQGLKHMIVPECQSNLIYSNARSTKTRIETDRRVPYSNLVSYSNARSTKTRIETQVVMD